MKKLLFLFFLTIPFSEIFTFEIKGQTGFYNLSPVVHFLEDKTSTLTLNQVIQMDDKFVQSNREHPSFGMTQSAIWGKLNLNPELSAEKIWYLMIAYSVVEHLDLYISYDDLVFKKYELGLLSPKRDTANNFWLPSIALDFKDQKKITIYFRALSVHEALELPLHLLSSQKMTGMIELYSIYQGLYYGVILVMSLFNLFIFFTIRDKSYLYYSIYILFSGVAIFLVFGHLLRMPCRYFFMEHFAFYRSLLNIFMVASPVFGIIFTQNFLQTKARHPTLHKVLSLIIWLLIFFFFLAFIHEFLAGIYYAIILITGSMVLLFAGILLYNKYVYVRYYVWGWGIYMILIVLFFLRSFNIHLPFSGYAAQIGGIVEATLFSMALAYRIRIITEEKEQARTIALEKEKTAEAEKHRHDLLAVRQELMARDLDIARNIQLQLISKSISERHIYTMYHPLGEVGGDLINLFPLSENKTGVLLCDVSGHGVSAALMTVIIKSFLSRKQEDLVKDGDNSDLFYPSRLLQSMNNDLLPYLEKHFVSVFYGIYDHTARQLSCSGAAHPPPMILERNSDNTCRLSFLPLKKQFFPVGYFFNQSRWSSEEYEFNISLSPGSRLIIYSDGMLDALDYTYDKAIDGLESFAGSFIYETLRDTFQTPHELWVGALSVSLLENRENWAVDDDVSAIFIEVT